MPELEKFKIESVVKETYGSIDQYNILFKETNKAPVQVSIVNDKSTNEMILLETKKVKEPEPKSVLDSAAPTPKTIDLTEIEKENIKVMSKLGTVKDIKEYKEVKLEEISRSDEFVRST